MEIHNEKRYVPARYLATNSEISAKTLETANYERSSVNGHNIMMQR